MKKIMLFTISIITLISVSTNAQWIRSDYPSPGATLLSQKFINSFTGWMSTYNPNKLYKTTNGGVNWMTINPNIAYYFSLEFVNESIGFAGVGNFFQKTTNGGESWFINPIQPRSWGYHKFINQDSGWVAGTLNIGGNIRTIVSFTTNGGASFRELDVYSHTITSLTVKKLLHDTTYTISWGGYYGTIRKSTNNGLNWTNDSVVIGSISQTEFITRDTGYCVNDIYGLFKTVNDGLNWIGIPMPTTSMYTLTSKFSGMKVFNNGQLIYGIGGVETRNNGFKTGIIWKSTNSGLNWTYITLDTINSSNEILSFDFIDENTGWAYYAYGGYRTTNGGTTFISLNSNNIPDKFYLSQNYPNPFNPSTRINYELRNTNYVTLKVFDLLGKEVTTLVNEKQNAGSYAVDFNSTEFNLPSGIYFYTLNAGEFKETRKMVLVK